MLESDYTKVFEGNFVVVQLVLDRLQSAGINAILKDGNQSVIIGFGATLQGFQEIYVSNEELDQALPIVNAVNSELQA
jgi:hypothetical protein